MAILIINNVSSPSAEGTDNGAAYYVARIVYAKIDAGIAVDGIKCTHGPI